VHVSDCMLQHSIGASTLRIRTRRMRVGKDLLSVGILVRMPAVDRESAREGKLVGGIALRESDRSGGTPSPLHGRLLVGLFYVALLRILADLQDSVVVLPTLRHRAVFNSLLN